MKRNTAIIVFSLGALAVGLLLGFFIFGNSNNNAVAGQTCTLPDGVTKGKTDSTGACKA